MRPATALIGVPAWNYRGPGGSMLQLAHAAALEYAHTWLDSR